MKKSLEKAAGIGLLSVCALLTPALAYAEAGSGIKGENLTLSLSTSAGTRFNNNLFYQSTPTAPGAFALFITPGLTLSSNRTDLVDVSLNWGLTWSQYLSSNQGISGQSGLNTDLGGSVQFNRAGAVSLKIEEAFQRTNEPPNNPSVDAIHRINNRLGGIVGIHPGGRALQGYLGYHWSSYNFQFDEINFSQSNRDEHEILGRFVWQFRPRTAAMATASYTFVNYDTPARVIAGNAAFPNNNSRPLRLTGTLNGLILHNLSAELTAGYGRANYASGASFSGAIGRALLSYYIRSNQSSSVSAGFQRSFQDTPLANYLLSNRFTLAYTQQFMDKRLQLEVGGSYDRRIYVFPGNTGRFPVVGGEVVLPTDGDIKDNRVGGNLNLTYNPLKWLKVGGAYRLNANITNENVEFVSVDDVGITLAGRDYWQHIFMASVTAHY